MSGDSNFVIKQGDGEVTNLVEYMNVKQGDSGGTNLYLNQINYFAPLLNCVIVHVLSNQFNFNEKTPSVLSMVTLISKRKSIINVFTGG